MSPSVWLQQHALGVAYTSVVVAVVSLALAALQIVQRPERGSSTPGAPTSEDQTLAASAISPGSGAPPKETAVGRAAQSGLEIQKSVRVLEPNYTVQPGDTLNRIAARFDTTVERIQAWNDLPDPRSLRVGARLVIPPPL
jgi:LysM repeat protein